MKIHRCNYLSVISLTIVLAAFIWCAPAFCGPIHDAASDGDLEKVKVLLKAKPSLVFSRNENNWTPLHCAAFHGNKEIVVLLLANGADVNAKSNEGFTPLQMAARMGNEDVVRLLSVKTNLNIFDAASLGDLETVKTLLKGNPELVFSKDSYGLTPLHAAAAQGRRGVVELLLANKADVNAKTKNGWTPLHYAANEAVLHGVAYEDLVKLLLANKANVNAPDDDGTTPLHNAAAGNRVVVELLVENGADVNAKNIHGYTPLDVAINMGAKDIADLLRQHGGHE
jgi:ankyrin repeat protein